MKKSEIRRPQISIDEVMDGKLSQILSRIEDILKPYQSSVDIGIEKVNGKVLGITLTAKIKALNIGS